MHMRRSLVIRLLIVALGAAFLFNCHVWLLDKVANTLLANEVRFDDRELPRSAYPIASSADNVQLIGGQGAGLNCSLPPGAQALAFELPKNHAPIALQMRQACAFHDYCYRHGSATYGYSQADCDFQLQQQVFRLCKFILKPGSIAICETNARKVTLGVRLGGWGSFKRARAQDEREASTYFEFDPYAVRSTHYRAVRIADAPFKWASQDFLPKAAYRFDIQPSGTRVRVYGWKTSGEMVCASFDMPGTYASINTPPMVIQDGSGQDWFVWWKRAVLSATNGSFAAMPVANATRQDWIDLSGAHTTLKHKDCNNESPWPTTHASNERQMAFVVAADQLFSQIQPVQGEKSPNVLRLVGLSNQCLGESKTCVVDVLLDINEKKPVVGRAVRLPIKDDECGDKKSCDTYRDHVGAPLVTSHDGRPSLTWLRRGIGDNGAGFSDNATMYRFDLTGTQERGSGKLRKSTLANFPETREPVFLLGGSSGEPTFMSLMSMRDKFAVRTQKAGVNNLEVAHSDFSCFHIKGVTWLQKPVALVPDPQDLNRSYMILNRTRMDRIDKETKAPISDLEVAVATIAQDTVQSIHYMKFEAMAPEFALAGNAPTSEIEAREKFIKTLDYRERLAERVRGGQVVIADLNKDGVPDLLQLVQLPLDKNSDAEVFFQSTSVVLLGSVDSGSLRFTRFHTFKGRAASRSGTVPLETNSAAGSDVGNKVAL